MKKLFSLAAFVALPVVACHIGETNFEEVTLPVTQQAETRTCDSAFVAVDLSTLTACDGGGRGKGHCYDPSKIAIPSTELAPCADATKSCVPDKILLANGQKNKSCTFLGGKPGACTSTLLNQINTNKLALQKDVCDDDERCGPCINPLDGTNSGLCDPAGAHTAACTGGVSDAKAEECCHGMGACMDATTVPSDQRDQLSKEVCSDGKLCAPASLANGKPVKCSALGFSGVCLDVCFAKMLQGAKAVMTGGCGPTEVCLPCLIGKGQGMPGCD